MTCPRCGTQLPDDALFCLRCGAPQAREAERAVSAAALQPPTAMLEAGDWERAVALAQPVLERLGNDAAVHQALRALYRRLIEAAVRAGNGEAAYDLAKLYREKSNDPEAIALRLDIDLGSLATSLKNDPDGHTSKVADQILREYGGRPEARERLREMYLRYAKQAMKRRDLSDARDRLYILISYARECLRLFEDDPGTSTQIRDLFADKLREAANAADWQLHELIARQALELFPDDSSLLASVDEAREQQCKEVIERGNWSEVEDWLYRTYYAYYSTQDPSVLRIRHLAYERAVEAARAASVWEPALRLAFASYHPAMKVAVQDLVRRTTLPTVLPLLEAEQWDDALPWIMSCIGILTRYSKDEQKAALVVQEDLPKLRDEELRSLLYEALMGSLRAAVREGSPYSVPSKFEQWARYFPPQDVWPLVVDYVFARDDPGNREVYDSLSWIPRIFGSQRFEEVQALLKKRHRKPWQIWR